MIMRNYEPGCRKATRPFATSTWLDCCTNNRLAIANVHGNFKTETHFGNSWLGPHNDSPKIDVGKTRYNIQLQREDIVRRSPFVQQG